MYLLVHFYLRVCCANTLLCSNTAIHGGSDTLRIFSSGTDAAGLNRSDISALPKFAMKSVHGRTLFMMQRSRCPAYLQKLFFPDLKNPRLLPQLFDKFIGRGYFQLRRTLHLIDGIVIGDMDKNIASALCAKEEILERLEL